MRAGQRELASPHPGDSQTVRSGPYRRPFHVRALLPRALDVLGQALAEGDRPSARALLKLAGVGAIDLGRTGSTDPDVIADPDARERARRDHERTAAEVRTAEQRRDLEMRRVFAGLPPT
jgi:hypothetical protein